MSAPPAHADADPITVGFVHLGCAKNLIDSEKLLGNLATSGDFLVGADPDDADVVIVNTCGFLDASRAESLDAIRRVLDRKATGHVGRVVVAGCMAQKDRELIESRTPEVDAVIGVADREIIAEVCRGRPVPDAAPPETAAPDAAAPGAAAPSVATSQIEFRIGSNERPPDPDDGRLRLTPPHYAYVRVSEGCDHPCTFCSIPAIRGGNKSKPLEQIVAEAEELAADGARELVIVGQDTADYGFDLYGKRRLHDVLASLAEVRGIEWIRTLYVHPVNCDDALIEALTSIPEVVSYVDMPIQHGVDRVLKRMLRKTRADDIRARVAALRERSPRHFFVRTTVIAGFPGETDEEFDELLEFLADVRFDRLGCFPYSFEEDTPSARLPGHLPLAVREERRNRVMALQQQIGFEVARAQVGATLEAIVDEVSTGESGESVAVGRTYGDCPEDDPIITLSGAEGVAQGDIVSVRVDASDGYDLRGSVLRTARPRLR